MDSGEVRSRAGDLPPEPGVYQFLDDTGEDATVLYVGKAVDLPDRVRSYADPRGDRIRRMVERAVDVEVVVTDTETQALLLEANLIKRHQPRYNVRLRDDKSYPLVQLTDHLAPRIEVTRDPDEGADVFGPFTEMGHVETVIKAIRETFGLRGCSDHKYANRDRPCLDYDIGLCSAPCTGEIDPDAYRDDVEAVRRFFRGETGVLAEPIRAEMDQAAESAAFERAANLRDRLDVVESFHAGGGGAVESTDLRTTDVLAVARADEAATVARLHSDEGSLVDRERHTVETPDGTRAGDVLAAFVPQYYAERALPDRLLLSDRLTDDDVESWLAEAGVDVVVPGAGREATLVDLALKNARRKTRPDDGVAALADALGLDAADRIEGFDVSHTGGGGVVGSDVCFVDGSPAKPDYRRKKLPEGNDDYAAMRSLLGWRAERAVAGRDDRPAPDLLLIDGGEGQLSAAREALDAAGWDVPAVGLAKAEERVITPERTYDWDGDAPQLRLLQRVRDEAHRFAVQYHETLRDDVSTALDDVPGVGPELRQRLLGRFGSVAGVRDASVAELRDVPGVGEATAKTIRRQL
ncbi:UvrABC system protein C [Halorhabdus tiamatea SARL4B]|uniref:UvrABC system protein C n=1 Tax=Halorhabdus tiamatea SARL4B TaxID=1033806 RepID=F7PL70_9EURY|nr:excinuclease ABC subunit C [Halorhabdus tiamatea]ERJ05825.1 UvrABC system protein C [Halorhabdus tiamatea SARL4B]CCQ34492.1 excinuclease ABC subunit C [Halorhabdus tiamatea SARL4B]